MTGEQYLIVSYFTVAGGGVVAALLTGAALMRPLRRALAIIAAPVGRLLGRTMFVWLVLAAMLAFLSVSYIDCKHETYQSVVEDYPHMAAVTHKQIENILTRLSAGVLAYALALAVLLVLPWRRERGS